MSPRRIWGLMYRHLVLFRTSWPRLFEIIYWPMVSMLVWGFTSRFFAARMGSPGAVMAGTLLGGVILWEVCLRSQMGFSVSFLEEIWSRNLGHLFVSPLRPKEMLTAFAGLAVLRMLIGVVPAALLAWGLYAFNVLTVGPVIVLFVAALVFTGFAVALMVISLIMRHGQGAEALAWSVMFGMAPISAIYYPVSVLPKPVQLVAQCLPTTHVFEGMRASLATGRIAWHQLGWAVLIDLIWLAAGFVLFVREFRHARVTGALVTIGE
jgi:ABC-2 type transport system permease protein